MALSLKTITETSTRVAQTRSRKKKTAALTECLAACDADDLPVVTSWLTGELVQGRIGLGPSLVRDVVDTPAASHASLDVCDVNVAMERLAGIAGKGAVARRRELLVDLLRSADEDEQRFLVRLWIGELRQGALEGVMVEAIAETADIDAAAVRRAVMLSGDIAAVAAAAVTGGEAALSSFRLQVGTPVAPMLAQPAESLTDALRDLGRAAIEYKMDGARVQVHRADESVRIFTRQLNEVTDRLPEIVSVVRSLPARRIVLDGEVIALRDDGRPHPFQVTMRRFGRRLGVEQARDKLPLTAFFFDCLVLGERELIDLPTATRYTTMCEALPAELIMPRVLTDDVAEADAFLRRALDDGHEGVMAKSLEAVYEAGNRGASWLKVKPVHTLDLVVLAAEWGSGRREGWLSNLHLGARDPESDDFVMLGKTFKGLTDKLLAWQTEKLLELERRREGHVVHVRPELVVEIAFNELQASPHYPAGLALRFARVRRYREDKRATEADTIAMVRELYGDG